MNLFDQNVPGLADLLSGQGAPAEQPTPVQGMADVVQQPQVPAPQPEAAPEKQGMFSSPEVRNMLMYGLMGLAKTGDIGTAMQSAVIAGAGTRHEQERLRKEGEDRELARRKQEQDMALRSEEMGLRREDMGLRKEELGMRRENSASEREYRAAQTAKTKSETSREDDTHELKKLGLLKKLEIFDEQIAASKDSRKTAELQRKRLEIQNRLDEIDVQYAPREKDAAVRGREISNEGGQLANAGKILDNRGQEIQNEGRQMDNAIKGQEYEKNAKVLEAYRNAPEVEVRRALLGLKGTAAKSEENELLQFAKDHAEEFTTKDGLDTDGLIRTFNKLKNGGLDPQKQLKLKQAARDSVPVGGLYIDPVTGNTYRRAK